MKALSLLFLREVEKKLDDSRAVPVKVSLQIDDGFVPSAPDVFFVEQELVGQPLGPQDFRVHANDQHLFVVGPVEDADAAALRERARRAPEKVVVQLGGAGMLEAEDLAALWIDARHDVPDRAVFTGGVHRLENQQNGVAA